MDQSISYKDLLENISNQITNRASFEEKTKEPDQKENAELKLNQPEIPKFQPEEEKREKRRYPIKPKESKCY